MDGCLNPSVRMAVNVVLVVALGCFGMPCRADDPAAVQPPLVSMDTKIVPGYVLNIVLEGEPEISHNYTVDSKGCVHFIIADSGGENKTQWVVSVSGKDSNDARAALIQSFSTYYKNPDVHITIVSVPGLHIEVSGEVQRQGIYVLPFNSHVSDLLTTAFTKPQADLTNVLVRRRGSASAPAPATFNIDLSLAASDEKDDPQLEDGDKVLIRKLPLNTVSADLQFVRVVGEINSAPGATTVGLLRSEDGLSVPIAKDMKLRDVLDRIGGLKDSADRAHLYLGRQDGSTRILSADKIAANDPLQNIPAKPGDLIIVPRRDRSLAFAVLGEVNAPNTFEIKPGEKIRLLDAIQRGGDLSKKADRHHGVLNKGYLLDPAKSRPIPFDPELVKKGKQNNMEIEPGDAVVIETRRPRPTIWQQLLPLALHFLPF